MNGIIRKLDGLGRIVIPREYRKMHKINVSDPLGIFAMDNGDIIIRKVDVSSALRNAGETVLTELSSATGLSALLCDTEKFLAATAGLGREIIGAGSQLDERLRTLIDGRKCVSDKADGYGLGAAQYAAVCPVYDENVFGALILVSDAPVSSAEEKMLRLAANILGNSMQRF